MELTVVLLMRVSNIHEYNRAAEPTPTNAYFCTPSWSAPTYMYMYMHVEGRSRRHQSKLSYSGIQYGTLTNLLYGEYFLVLSFDSSLISAIACEGSHV